MTWLSSWLFSRFLPTRRSIAKVVGMTAQKSYGYFGLVGLLSTMHLLGRRETLYIHGPKGLDEIVEIQFRNAGNHLSFKMEFRTVDKAGDTLYEDSKITIKRLL